MISMARVTVRKNMITGEIVDKRVEPLPDDPAPEITFLGKLYAEKLSKDQHFLEFCDEYRRQNIIA